MQTFYTDRNGAHMVFFQKEEEGRGDQGDQEERSCVLLWGLVYSATVEGEVNQEGKHTIEVAKPFGFNWVASRNL